jgi:dihydrofolate reductase
MHVSLDGYYAKPNGEIDWFKGNEDPEFAAFAGEQAQAGSTLIFGRTTYDMMASYWPTPEAARGDPHMAQVMRESPKIVFSRTLERVDEGPHWRRIELLREIDADAISKAKEVDNRSFTILGSGSIVQQFTRLGLIDEYRLVVNPVVLGEGRHTFAHVDEKELELREARSFASGLVWLCYRPV